MPPTISIILPTYNREKFLPEAFAAIAAQEWTDWELIVVDDGSTDGTARLVEKFKSSVSQSVSYIYQENAGHYVARNRGFSHARGELIAPYDSDDLWLPHHLNHCVQAFEACSEVDWIYAACQRVDYETGNVITPSTFYNNGKRQAFLMLPVEKMGQLNLLDHNRLLEKTINTSLYSGQQNSLIRRTVFEKISFTERYRRIEDTAFVLRAIHAGFRIGYINDVHVVYRVHDSNISGAASHNSYKKQLDICQVKISILQELLSEFTQNKRVCRELRKQIGKQFFWDLGYSTYWMNHNRCEAMNAYAEGIKFWPWSPLIWKTLGLCWIKNRLGIS